MQCNYFDTCVLKPTLSSKTNATNLLLDLIEHLFAFLVN